MARKASPRPPADEPPPLPLEDASEGRLLRVGGDRGLSLAERLTAQVSGALYATPLHRLRLKGRQPLRLLGVPEDPVPGNAAIGERIFAGRLIHADQMVMTRDLTFLEPGRAPAWRDWANGWEWLRDLAAHAPSRSAGAAVAEPLVDPLADGLSRIRPGRLARRCDRQAAAVRIWPCAADPVLHRSGLSRRACWARSPPGHGILIALPSACPMACPRRRRCAAFMLPACSSPAAKRAPHWRWRGSTGCCRRWSCPMAAWPAARRSMRWRWPNCCCSPPPPIRRCPLRPPPLFADVLGRLVPSLRGLALGDNMVGAWHGGAAIGPVPLERLAKRSATGTALFRGGRWSGYYRLSAGRTVLVIDAGPPPLARSGPGHAGTLAFELSDGADRLITNCGGEKGLASPLPGPLAAGLRTTPAHSTLTIADTNSTRLRDDGALGLGVEEVTVQSRSSEEGHWLEASHDGYAKRFGMIVRRRLFLSPDGQDLRGEDVIEPARVSKLRRRPDREFDVRFHLGPGVTATPTADGAGALLKLPQGRVWAMKARGGKVSIEASLWIDPGGTIHKTQQLVVTGRTDKAAASVGWSFKRAGK